MPNTTTVNASIVVQDASVTPAVTVAQNSVADQQTGLAEFSVQNVILPTGVVFGSPLTVNLAVFRPKSVFISSDRKFEMKIGTGADIHRVNSTMLVTFSGSEPAQLLFATGAGVTLDTNIKIALGSAHP